MEFVPGLHSRIQAEHPIGGRENGQPAVVEDAPDFRHVALDVDDVLDDLEACNHTECPVGEWQSRAVGVVSGLGREPINV